MGLGDLSAQLPRTGDDGTGQAPGVDAQTGGVAGFNQMKCFLFSREGSGSDTSAPAGALVSLPLPSRLNINGDYCLRNRRNRHGAARYKPSAQNISAPGRLLET